MTKWRKKKDDEWSHECNSKKKAKKKCLFQKISFPEYNLYRKKVRDKWQRNKFRVKPSYFFHVIKQCFNELINKKTEKKNNTLLT